MWETKNESSEIYTYRSTTASRCVYMSNSVRYFQNDQSNNTKRAWLKLCPINRFQLNYHSILSLYSTDKRERENVRDLQLKQKTYFFVFDFIEISLLFRFFIHVLAYHCSTHFILKNKQKSVSNKKRKIQARLKQKTVLRI